MSRDPFPEHTDATKLFARNGLISAVLPVSRLQRLQASLADPGLTDACEVLVDLEFSHDEEGRRRLQGSLQTNVTQLCQRCLQPMQEELNCSLDLLVLDSESELRELNELPDAVAALDVIVDEAGELDVLALIEDELLLSLPLVPMHEDADCSAVLNDLKRKAEAAEASGAGKKPNPFAVLATLKQDKN
jgi:uncharacterized protein